MNYSAGISRFFRIFCSSFFFFSFGCRLDVKKININPEFFFSPLYFFHRFKHYLSPPQISWKPDPEEPRTVRICCPNPFRGFCTALARASRPQSDPPNYFFASKGRFFCLFPLCARLTAAEWLQIRSRSHSKAFSGFLQMCGWRCWELLQMLKFHSFKKTQKT